MDLINTLDRLLSNLGIATDITRFLAIFGLGMARLLGAILLIPFLGGAVVPGRAKVGLAVIITGVLFPVINVELQIFNLRRWRSSRFSLKRS